MPPEQPRARARPPRRERPLPPTRRPPKPRPRPVAAARPAAAARRSAAGVVLSAVIPAIAVGAFAVVEATGAGAGPAAAVGPARFDAAAVVRTAREPLRPVLTFVGRGRPLVAPAGLAGGVRPAPPARISIPAAGVRAPVDRVGATEAGIEVPALGRAGWYEGGPRPGERGRAVVIGHLDTRGGPGLFALLSSVDAGAEIAVTGADGERHRFEVVRKRQVPKTAFPSEAVYGPSQKRELVLVTCGGPWLGEGYRDNVIVFARAL